MWAFYVIKVLGIILDMQLYVTLSGQGGLFTGPILGLDKTVLIVGLGNLSNVLSGAIRTGPKGKY